MKQFFSPALTHRQNHFGRLRLEKAFLSPVRTGCLGWAIKFTSKYYRFLVIIRYKDLVIKETMQIVIFLCLIPEPMSRAAFCYCSMQLKGIGTFASRQRGKLNKIIQSGNNTLHDVSVFFHRVMSSLETRFRFVIVEKFHFNSLFSRPQIDRSTLNESHHGIVHLV